MKRMTYISSFARELTAEEIDAIGTHASERNRADAVTGVN